MLRGDAAAVDLESERDNLFTTFAAQIDALKAEHGESSIELLRTDAVNEFSYPVIEYPTKIVSHNLEKTPIVSGTLLGLKGRSEEHTSELQSRPHLVCRLLLEKKKKAV